MNIDPNLRRLHFQGAHVVYVDAATGTVTLALTDSAYIELRQAMARQVVERAAYELAIEEKENGGELVGVAELLK